MLENTNKHTNGQRNRQTARLLVVEDNLPYLDLITEAFRDSGAIDWQISVANDGEQALKLLSQEEKENSPLPNFILLDWNLPKVNGSEVLRSVKDHIKLRTIPVLVFSSSEADGDIQAAYDCHANGYIVKPNSLDQLTAVVEAIEQFWVVIARVPQVAW
jgi:CheY-like chemotaxis protein